MDMEKLIEKIKFQIVRNHLAMASVLREFSMLSDTAPTNLREEVAGRNRVHRIAEELVPLMRRQSLSVLVKYSRLLELRFEMMEEDREDREFVFQLHEMFASD